jgi:hypothetical protein
MLRVKGAKPSDLPIEEPAKFEIAGEPEDSQRARPGDAARADEVIE